MAELLSVSFVLFGLFFCVIGVYGLLRFPDVYSRIHASGKVSTLGLIGLIIGSGFLVPSASLKLIALVGFLIMTAPVAAHTVANAAYRSGVAMAESKRDDLAGDPRVKPMLENVQNRRNYKEDKERLAQVG